MLSNNGATTVTITSVTNVQTGCTATANESTTFEVFPAPDLSSVNVIINDVCKGQPVNVAISGLGSVASITVLYSISGANNNAGQTIDLNVTTGNANFVLPGGLLANTGDTTFQLISITTHPNGCIIPLMLSKSFTIHPIPEVNNFLVAIPNICKGQPLTVRAFRIRQFRQP
ncbi:hypothetical protein [Flavobacterium sp. 3HN19-14]|uniref:hypothetical protein n=1 Tax=Flavobacterium sp. 3HN19-14 TaxID=3448133 RepID=UPI003EE08EC1